MNNRGKGKKISVTEHKISHYTKRKRVQHEYVLRNRIADYTNWLLTITDVYWKWEIVLKYKRKTLKTTKRWLKNDNVDVAGIMLFLIPRKLCSFVFWTTVSDFVSKPIVYKNLSNILKHIQYYFPRNIGEWYHFS